MGKAQENEEENVEKVPAPEGAKALMISMREMDTYDLKTGPKLHETVDFKFFNRAEILQQIQANGFMCPFHEARANIQSSKEEQILIVADRDEKYGENWLLCYTAQSICDQMAIFEEKEQAMKDKLEEEEREKKKAEEALNAKYEEKPIVVQQWITSTSAETHEEVEQLSIQTINSTYIQATITRPFKELNAQYKFNDRDSDQCFVECRQHKDPNYELSKLEQDIGLQAIPVSVDDSSQTSWFRAVNSSLQYESVKMDEENLSTILESEELKCFLDRALVDIEESLQQNETMDIFLDDFENLVEDDIALGNKSENNIKELRTFTDLEFSKNKTLPAIDWHPKKKGIIAVAAATNVTFTKRIQLSEKIELSYLLIWSFSDLIHPQFMLEAPQDILCFRFNPSQPHIIAGGTYNGQVMVWDISEAEEKISQKNTRNTSKEDDSDEALKTIPPVKPLCVSYIDHSHRRCVADLVWLPAGVEISNRGHLSATNDPLSHQFMTIAGDGQVCFWDLRYKDPDHRSLIRVKADKKLTGKDGGVADPFFLPIFKITVNKVEGIGELGLSCISIDANRPDETNDKKFTVSSLFHCGTEEGEVLLADWKPHENSASKKDDERGNNEDTSMEYIKWMGQNHFRSIVSLERSPFFPELNLSVGDWTFNVWKNGVNQPIFSSCYAVCHLTCGRWSPTRPGVIIIGKFDGTMDIWDLLDQSHRPSNTVHIASSAITSMEFLLHKSQTVPKQQLLAVGDDTGNLHVLDIPRNLWRYLHNEKALMSNFFSRETKRLDYVLVRQKEQEAAIDNDESSGISQSINPPTTSSSTSTENENSAGTAASKSRIDSKLTDQIDEKAEEEFRKTELAFRMELKIDDKSNDEVNPADVTVSVKP